MIEMKVFFGISFLCWVLDASFVLKFLAVGFAHPRVCGARALRAR